MDEPATQWNGPSGLEVSKVSGGDYSISIDDYASEAHLMLRPDQWADLVAACAELGTSFGAMP